MGFSEFVQSAADSAISKANEVLRSPSTAEKVAAAEDWVTEKRMSRKLGSETFRGRRLKVHRGYVSGGTVKVLARLSESARMPEESSLPYFQVAKANVQRHWSLALPGLEVEARLGDASARGVSDRHGFVPLTLQLSGLAPGWHAVDVRTISMSGEAEVAGRGHAVLPHPDAPFLVVSDVDDTVIKSGLAEGMSSVRRTLLGDSHTRMAIPGMSSFYRGLQRGVPGAAGQRTPEPTWFYLSTGSWSFYEMLTQFLQLRGFPRGPLFLTDWGPTDRYLHRSGTLHKQHTLRRLFAAYPQHKFLLVGDAGQADFTTYCDMAVEFPDRVLAVIIVPAGGPERVAELQEQAPARREAGINVHVVDSVVDAAIAARDLGLIDNLAIDEVRTEVGAVF